MKLATSILGMKVSGYGGFEGVIEGTDEEPKLRVEASCCLRQRGSIGRYLNAGQTYSLIDTNPKDAYFKDYVVPDTEVNDEARRNGGSVIDLQISINKKTGEVEYLSIEVDS